MVPGMPLCVLGKTFRTHEYCYSPDTRWHGSLPLLGGVWSRKGLAKQAKAFVQTALPLLLVTLIRNYVCQANTRDFLKLQENRFLLSKSGIFFWQVL